MGGLAAFLAGNRNPKRKRGNAQRRRASLYSGRVQGRVTVPLSPVDGKPMQRASLNEVRLLLNEVHDQESIGG